MRCHECKGTEFERQNVEIITKIGNHAVIDRSVVRPVCRRCGEFAVSAEVLQKAELRAAVVVFTEAPSVTGDMLRLARKALDLTQVGFAQRLGTTAESVSRWEREERPMEPWVPLATLGLVRAELMPPPRDITLKRAS
ncbi:MAG TPA: type II toxin-antitoxin system MqsA family antitoxin [Polyangiaceae bacterium]|jgi:YgiT-type zinc finger domain-containing protein|nr:type II toxin-antitoxin system MqsA family antitoxin [Polyangiaceae bacterium]